jgi:hypothetical protein
MGKLNTPPGMMHSISSPQIARVCDDSLAFSPACVCLARLIQFRLRKLDQRLLFYGKTKALHDSNDLRQGNLLGIISHLKLLPIGLNILHATQIFQRLGDDFRIVCRQWRDEHDAILPQIR